MTSLASRVTIVMTMTLTTSRIAPPIMMPTTSRMATMTRISTTNRKGLGSRMSATSRMDTVSKLSTTSRIITVYLSRMSTTSKLVTSTLQTTSRCALFYFPQLVTGFPRIEPLGILSWSVCAGSIRRDSPSK